MIGNPTPRIFGAGVCCQDYIFTAPIIEWGGHAHVKDFHSQGGGLVATALVAASRLGAKCKILSCLGDDSVGDEIIQGLKDEKICTQFINRVPGGHSPFSFVHVDEKSGERTIFHRPGSRCVDYPEAARSEIMQSDCLLVDDVYAELATKAAQSAREAGVPVIGDMTPGDRGKDLLPWVDILIAPKTYIHKLGLEDNPFAALDCIHQLGPSVAVITLGADGWIYSSGEGKGSGKAFKVRAVDTTGAGDSFHGAFAFAFAQGWDIEKCCTFASAVAAIKCTKPGGRTGLPDLRTVLDFLKWV